MTSEFRDLMGSRRNIQKYFSNNGLANREGEDVSYSELKRSPVKPAYLGNSTGESITNRGVRYSVKTCLTIRDSGAELTDEPVEIRIFNMTKGSDINYLDNSVEKPLKRLIKTTTSEDGCVNWVDEIWYRHYKPEKYCLLYTSPSPRDQRGSRMPSSA